MKILFTLLGLSWWRTVEQWDEVLPVRDVYPAFCMPQEYCQRVGFPEQFCTITRRTQHYVLTGRAREQKLVGPGDKWETTVVTFL